MCKDHMKRICLILWMLVPVPMVLTGITASLDDAVKVVDIAREKDITWLSLALAGAAIGFSVWLVVRGDKRQDSATGALLKVAASRRVSFGTNDSAGAGFKVLKVAN